MKLEFDLHFLSSAYGDSNDEHAAIQFEESHPEPQESPFVPVPPRPTHCVSSPFDMIDFMHKTSSYKLDHVFRAADALLLFQCMFLASVQAVEPEEPF
jgi:hypothetical protein